jgi:hypothetical protein
VARYSYYMLWRLVELGQVAAVDTLDHDVIHTATTQHCHCQLPHYCYWHLCIELYGSVETEGHIPTESLSE